MKLSVIIVSYNVLPFLQLCLASLQHALKGLDAEIIVADNNSTDGSADWLRTVPGITPILIEKNIGFGAANNLALKGSKGEFVLLLNPDTIVDSEAIQSALCSLKQNENIGATGIQMKDGSGRFLPESKRGKPTAAASFYRFSGLASLFPSSKHFAAYYQGHLHSKQNHEVPVLAGAFILARRSLLQALDGFDERFFMYAEDIDLSYRMIQAGYKNYYIGERCIVHFKGESSYPLKQEYVKQFYQAMQLFVQKHYAAAGRSLIANLLEKSIKFLSALTASNRKRRKPRPLLEGGEKVLKMHYMNVDDAFMGFTTGKLNNITIGINYTAVANNWLIILNDSLNLNQLTHAMRQAPASTIFWFTAPGLNFMLSSNSAEREGDVVWFNTQG